MESLRIIYMGTPDFAVAPLEKLIEANCNIVAVVTPPDKKAGRGQKLQQSAVKKAALKHNIPVLQPEKLRDDQFLSDLKSYKADLQIVVAFRMLPKVVWDMPKYGTFNLHASLLPQYRGAAPINWAVINGEKETGVTTFFINEDIDTGNIIFQEKVAIEPTDNAGIVHDKLMTTGAELVVNTVAAIQTNTISPIPQDQLLKNSTAIKAAPKIFKEDCKINWENDTVSIYNQIRGFSPSPGAWTTLVSSDSEELLLKIYASEYILENNKNKAGAITTLNKKQFAISTSNGFIIPNEIQLPGKKRMTVEQVLAGTKIDENWKCL